MLFNKKLRVKSTVLGECWVVPFPVATRTDFSLKILSQKIWLTPRCSHDSMVHGGGGGHDGFMSWMWPQSENKIRRKILPLTIKSPERENTRYNVPIDWYEHLRRTCLCTYVNAFVSRVRLLSQPLLSKKLDFESSFKIVFSIKSDS
jgi:hypothetical protein